MHVCKISLWNSNSRLLTQLRKLLQGYFSSKPVCKKALIRIIDNSIKANFVPSCTVVSCEGRACIILLRVAYNFVSSKWEASVCLSLWAIELLLWREHLLRWWRHAAVFNDTTNSNDLEMQLQGRLSCLRHCTRWYTAFWVNNRRIYAETKHSHERKNTWGFFVWKVRQR